MDFTNIVFPCFLSVVFFVYWFLFGKDKNKQNILLLTVSYVFYGWWDWRFLLLIITTSASTYLTARGMHGQWRKPLLVINIVINLSILFVFKYLNFFGENLIRLLSNFGWSIDWFTIDILLPVGISFYTFQAIGYSVDVYRDDVEPVKDLVSFFTFIAYFPQLVVGPIERATQLLPQIQKERNWNYRGAVAGMKLILLGLLKKLCVADTLSIWSDRIFDQSNIGALSVCVGAVLFSIVIYCDFSAYSEIAKGVSALLGIRLMKNFNSPFFSRNIVEFWSRWHISLLKWFRDYVYIPLGGNRKGKIVALRNVFIVFLLSGLWHGASWNFVIWGLYWAFVYAVGKFIFLCKRIERPIVKRDVPSMVIVCAFVFWGFFIFRCNDMTQILCGLKGLYIYIPIVIVLWIISNIAVEYPKCFIVCLISLVIVVYSFFSPNVEYILKMWWLLPAALIVYIEWGGRNCYLSIDAFPQNRVVRWGMYWVSMTFILLSEPIGMKFIYFQF